MKKEKYDLIFSIGATCACSQILREAGLQHASFPYDWAFCNNLQVKIDRLCGGLGDLLAWDGLRFLDDPGMNRPCWTDEFGFRWPHDLRPSIPLEEQLPDARRKIERRSKRLLRLLDSARRVLVVFIDSKVHPTPSEEDIHRMREQLVRRWPQSGIEVLFLRNDPGVGPESARIKDGDGCRIIDIDCCAYDGNSSGGIHEILGAFLAGLYEVVDYRTPEERREGPRKRRLAKYGKFAAKTFCGYCWNVMQYKLYRHLDKRMRRKGLV